MEFDTKLTVDCARAFSEATELPCAVSTASGELIASFGASCAECALCALAGVDVEKCREAQIYGMTEAERFGGKYIYFCAMMLTCFVSPIFGAAGSEARITVGPFLMVERDDYRAYELEECLKLAPETISRLAPALANTPVVAPARVTGLSTLLFMAVSFINDHASSNRMLKIQKSEAMQGQITSYIMKAKSGGEDAKYPFDLERALLDAISEKDEARAHRLLNELLGGVFFATGARFPIVKTRIIELIVLLSRCAASAGADGEESLIICHKTILAVEAAVNLEDMCVTAAESINRLMAGVFYFKDARHDNSIHRIVSHIQEHYMEKLTMADAARWAYLSCSYFGRVFKRETGATFNVFLNTLRVEKSKAMLAETSMRLADIALAVGFEDQSYFSRVFRKLTGVTPLRYRELNPRTADRGTRRSR